MHALTSQLPSTRSNVALKTGCWSHRLQAAALSAQGMPLHGPVAKACCRDPDCTPALHRFANMRVSFIPY